MVSLTNSDSSFFEIVSDDIDLDIITKDVISFSFTEEMLKLSNGTLSLYDPNQIYTKTMIPGAGLKISFGYKDQDLSPLTALGLLSNPTEFKGLPQRLGVKARITSVDGSANSQGFHIMNINFISNVELAAERFTKVYSIGTKLTVVVQMLANMGIVNSHVLFNRMAELITPDTAIRQHNKTDFKMLTDLANRWGALFRIGYDPLGLPLAIFVSPSAMDKTPFNNFVTGSVGLNHLFEYKDGIRNVISYKWKNNISENGTGDSVRIVRINGKDTTIRSRAVGEKVLTWRLDMNAIKREFNRRKKQGMRELNKFKNEVTNVAVSDFQAFVKKKFWVPIEEHTAPQGVGYTVNLKLKGNALMTAPNRVKFGAGFPPRIGDDSTKFFYVRKVDHNIDSSGYFSEVECIDINTLVV